MSYVWGRKDAVMRSIKSEKINFIVMHTGLVCSSCYNKIPQPGQLTKTSEGRGVGRLGGKGKMIKQKKKNHLIDNSGGR